MPRVLLFSLLLSLTSTLASPQGEPARVLDRLPDTPAGTAAATLIRTFNANQLEAARWRRWRLAVGPVEARRIEEASPRQLRVWVEGTTSRGWLGFEVRVDSLGGFVPDQAPVFWMGGGPPPELRQAALRAVEDRELARRLAAYFEAMEKADLFSGSVIVARHGRVLFEGAFGWANREQQTRNQMVTRFPIASVGKAITAAALGKLVAEGKLSFDDPLSRFLPDYPIAASRGATVGQLLAHTAGLGRASTDWIALRENISLAELVRRVAAPPEFAPGTDTRYCNECYLVAGLIVERVSGVSYEEYVRRNILAPAGMVDTNWEPITSLDPRRAATYTVATAGGPAARRDASDLQGLKGTPAGGAYSTARDMVAFLDALRSARLFPLAITAELLAPRTELPFGRANGYGFELAGHPDRVGKGGNAPGTSAQIEMYPESGHTVVILSNYDSSAQVAATAVRALAFHR